MGINLEEYSSLESRLHELESEVVRAKSRAEVYMEDLATGVREYHERYGVSLESDDLEVLSRLVAEEKSRVEGELGEFRGVAEELLKLAEEGKWGAIAEMFYDDDREKEEKEEKGGLERGGESQESEPKSQESETAGILEGMMGAEESEYMVRGEEAEESVEDEVKEPKKRVKGLKGGISFNEDILGDDEMFEEPKDIVGDEDENKSTKLTDKSTKNVKSSGSGGKAKTTNKKAGLDNLVF